MAVHHEPPRTRPVVLELDADQAKTTAATTTRTTARPATYVVKPGDTLWSIARHFYRTGFGWTRIWNANKQISDPNQIQEGQRLVIPPPGSDPPATTEAQSAVPATTAGDAEHAGQLPGVPGEAASYIAQAATMTGLKVSVVAAQNFIESHYGSDDGPSSAGAMGPWQFEPATWAQFSNAPFSDASDWQASTSAYINYMRALMQWSGGNVQMALAAYNAGQANWQAGTGYANTILSIAG